NNRVLPRLYARDPSSRLALKGDPSMSYVASSLLTSAALVTLARRHGLSWAELGLDRRTVPAGLVGAVSAAGAVAAVYAAGLAVPGTRALFADERAAPRLSGAAYQA